MPKTQPGVGKKHGDKLEDLIERTGGTVRPEDDDPTQRAADEDREELQDDDDQDVQNDDVEDERDIGRRH